MKDIRIALAVVQASTCDAPANLAKMESWIHRAKDRGAAVICFPELNISGYDVHNHLPSCAEPVPGPATNRLSNWAIIHRMTILAGLVEQSADGRLFASHIVASMDGNTAVYRKSHLAPPEKALFTAGGQIPLFKQEAMTFGIQLCYDAHFPELSTQMAVHGADLIFFPHASPRGTPEEKLTSWLRHLTARAFDNSVYVAACNQCGDNGSGLSFPGCAVVIDPSGKVVNKDVSGNETLLITDIKAERLNRVRNHQMRYFLPHRRPDLYKA